MAPDPYECMVCEQTYNNENRRPLVLPCNHSFCQRCLQGVKASNTPVCPMCRYDLSRSSIKDFVFCHQLVPGEDELKKKNAEKNRNEVEETRVKRRNVCKQHEDLDYLFWCRICNCPACMKCLHRMHKHCDWVVLEEHVRNLGQELGECSKVYSEQVSEMHRAGFTNRRQLKTVKRAIGGLKGLEEQLEMYYKLLASVHGDAEECLDELAKCKEDANSGAVDPLVLLKRKVEITAQLQDLLRMPDQPDMPLLHLLENYEASVNMALMPEEKRSKLEFPKTLAGFGYRFKDGKLENVDTGEGFNFVVKENNHAYNQAHYEALGEVMDKHIYALLTHECGLKKVPVPIEGNANQPSSFIFATDNWKTCNRLMILIHGSGVVKAGQWARRLIINDCLNSGTQMPYIHRAKSEGYGVLVLNTNNTRAVDESGRTWPIRGSEDPTSHADTVWRQYVMQSEADHIAIVAHSYGGCVATHLFTQFTNDFNKRVFAVALTDSVHMIHNAEKFEEFIKRSCNWVTSNLPLDTDMSRTRQMDVHTVSAGVTAHEMTSWGSFNSVFEFFSNRYHDKTNERIPMIRKEDYLFYPPSPPVRPRLQEESLESLSLFGQAAAHQVAEPMSGANNQGAVGGGDYDDDGQEQQKEDQRRSRRRSSSRQEPKDQGSDSDSEYRHCNDRLEEGRHDDEHRCRQRKEVKEKEDQENVRDLERHQHRHSNERREKSEQDEDEVKDRVERRRRRKERHEETEDREIISDSEGNHHSKDGRKKEKRDDDEEKTERRRRRKVRRGETEDREINSDSERNHLGKDERKKEKRDDDKEKTGRRKESHGETGDREIISDSERNHHSKDGSKKEKRDDDEEKIRRRQRREKRRMDREGQDSEHSHRSNRGKDQDGEDYSHQSSDQRRSVDHHHGHGTSSDSGHSSRRHHKKHERHRSSRNNRHVDEDGSGAESDNGEGIHKKEDREGKKGATTGKESSDDEHTEEGGKVEDSQGASRRSNHREERRSRTTANKAQQQDVSQKGDGGSNAESSGDEDGVGGENDSTVDQGRSEEKDVTADEDRSGDDGKSADEDVSGDEGPSCEEYLTPDAMEPDNKCAKSAKVGSATQNGAADKNGRPAAEDNIFEDCASKDGQGAYAKTKQAEPAEDDAARHRSESGASDRGEKEDESVRSKRQT